MSVPRTASPAPRFDLAVIGAGVVGLAHALAAARAGLKVVVIERDLRANGASIRNFGFITVTGQAAGEVWPVARRARDIWADIAPRAGIAIEHQGLILTLRRPESLAVAEAFLATDMGEGCELLDAAELKRRYPRIASADALGALISPHELRVESARAIRIVDASKRRMPLQKKVGAGMSVEEFRAQVAAGTIKHHGLP